MKFLKNEAKELLLFLIFLALLLIYKHTIGSLILSSENLFLQWFYDMDAQGVQNMLNYEARNKPSYTMFMTFKIIDWSILSHIRWRGILSVYIYYRICTYLYCKYQQWRNKKESSILEIQTISKKDRLIFELKIVIDFILCFIVFDIFFVLIMNWLTPTHVDESETLPMALVLIFFGMPFALYISYRITKIIRNKTWRRILNHG
ncbi:hypothetical protein PJV93_09800 [Aliarcobacter butzleri]|uniref:Uncharacterized protein n=1 Tax=Aliarcobacter butzleri TaxID=28197 RepID=A0AAW7QE60_9BACT|nr:hypothetical protein [Aliarcobacter butzleri]MCG3664427.1 hypothetical protein [Aliarcobacter butzleri]MDN5107906.1 hypothetical protein [Aliarcobacter butzleri]MDN5124198.1 hypothetical protein [Aliarcobacter butzleri]